MTLLTLGLIYSELLPRLVAVVNTGSRTNESAQLSLQNSFSSLPFCRRVIFFALGQTSIYGPFN